MVVIAHDANSIPRFLYTDATGRLYVRLSDGTTDLYIDPVYGSITTENIEHRMTLASNMWLSSYTWIAIPTATSKWIHIKVGASKNAVISWTVSTEAKAWYYLYENPTLTNDGTALLEASVNRQDLGVSVTQVYRDPTITNVGTQLLTGMIGTSAGPRRVGGSTDAAVKWLLKRGESYLLGVNNQDAAAKDINIILFWHET